MTDYYVKNGGDNSYTAGSYDPTSDSWASASDNIEEAIVKGAGAGDRVLVSDAHAYTSTLAIEIDGNNAGAATHIILVEDADPTTSSIETVTPNEKTLSGGDLNISAGITFEGLYLESTDNVSYLGPNSDILFKNCIVVVEDQHNLIADGCSVVYVNSTLKYASADAPLNMAGGSMFAMYGGVAENIGANFISGNFTAGGGQVRLIGTDCSSITGTIITGIGGTFGDDMVDIVMRACKLNATAPAWTNESFKQLNHRFVATNCGSTSAHAEYQFYTQAPGGTVEEQDTTGIYRADSTAFPGGMKISLKCQTNADATAAAPFWFDFPSRFVELSDTGSDVIRIYLASNFTTAPTDLDIWAEVVYPDGTNKHEYNYLSSRNANILGSGTTLTTDSGSDWRNGASALSGYDEQYIELDIGTADPGADGVPIIRVYVAKFETAKTIYFCPTIGLS